MKNLKGYLITILAAICWGFSGTMGEYLLGDKHLNVYWLTSVRMLLAGAILLLYVVLRNGITESHKRMITNKKTLLHLIAYGILGMAFNQTSYLQSIHYSNAGTATVLQYSGTILLVGVVCIKLARWPYKTELFAMILALIGTFVLATHGNLDKLVLTQEALMWGGLSAIALVTLTLIPIPLTKEFGSSLTVGYGLLTGGIFSFFAFNTLAIPVQLDVESLFALAGIVIVGTILAFNLFLYGIQQIGSIKASLIACLEPVAAIVFSMVLLGTKFVWMDILGSAIIVLAAVIVSIFDLIESRRLKASGQEVFEKH